MLLAFAIMTVRTLFWSQVMARNDSPPGKHTGVFNLVGA
jgi:hypothetical protein